MTMDGRRWLCGLVAGLASVLVLGGVAVARDQSRPAQHRHHHHQHHRRDFLALGFFGVVPGFWPYPSYRYREQAFDLPAQPGAAAPVTQEDCRQYRSEATVEGRTKPVYGFACPRLDGRWEIISQWTSDDE